MKINNKINHWVTGTSVTVASLSIANAATVRVDLNHDLTNILDGIEFPDGLGLDIGQWAGFNTSAFVGRRFARFLFAPTSSLARVYNNFVSAAGGYRLGSTAGLITGYSAQPGGALGEGESEVGFIAWNLVSGVEGWLEITGTRVVGFDNNGLALFPTLFATGFIYDDSVNARPAFDRAEFEALAVPEPSGVALLALGAAGVMMQRRRQTA